MDGKNWELVNRLFGVPLDWNNRKFRENCVNHIAQTKSSSMFYKFVLKVIKWLIELGTLIHQIILLSERINKTTM